MNQKTIAVDFDGVIHRYSRGWQEGHIYDNPVEGSLEALSELANKEYRIAVFTTREDCDAVLAWLNWHWDISGIPGPLPVHEITNKKPLAVAYIDDRGIRFTTWRDVLNYF